VETLSDHRYIRFDVSEPSRGICARIRGTKRPPRWAKKHIDKDLLTAAAIVKARTGEIADLATSDEGAVKLRESLTEICDVAMPRNKPVPDRKTATYWTPELAVLRRDYNTVRKRYTKCRRRLKHILTMEDQLMAETLRKELKVKKLSLQRAIKRAKARAWDELVRSIDEDPWGRPYKIVRKKLAKGGPPIIERVSSPSSWIESSPPSSPSKRWSWENWSSRRHR